jgi:hypothetical protein
VKAAIMTSDFLFLRELRRLSTAWHDEVSLLRNMATQAPTLLDKHNVTVMADTYLVCATALDKVLGDDSEAEESRARAQHA